MALFGRPTAQDEAKALAYRQWMEARNPWAVASLVLGIFSFIEMGVLYVLGIGGIIAGVVALKKLSNPIEPAKHGRRLAWTGIVLSASSLVLATILYSRVLG
jgi:hypothetical protein